MRDAPRETSDFVMKGAALTATYVAYFAPFARVAVHRLLSLVLFASPSYEMLS